MVLLTEWSQRQLLSKTTAVERVVQPLAVHFCDDICGWFSVTWVPTCWPYATARKQKEIKDAAGNIASKKI